MRMKPFRAWRPRPDLAAAVASPPYDVVDTNEARAQAEGNPYSFLHVIRPEIDLEPEIAFDDPRVYEQAKTAFGRMKQQGWLVQDEAPAFYVYRQTLGGHVQTGIVGAAAVADYDAGRIKKHELTREAKERDRTRHIESIGAHAGPVFLTYRPTEKLAGIVDDVVAADPNVDFEAPDGVRHTLWVVADAGRVAAIESAFTEVPESYVADGHHRAASAARVARESGAGKDASFLTVLFPSDQLQVLDYNRVVRDLNGLTPESFLAALEARGMEVDRRPASPRPEAARTFGVYVGGAWSRVTFPPALVPEGDPARRLDVAVLSEQVLGPLLGIGDVRTDPRIDFVGGSRGIEGLEERVDSGGFAVAFAVYPTRVDDVMTVADAGQVMPPKSTWFEPKLRSGLVILATGSPQ